MLPLILELERKRSIHPNNFLQYLELHISNFLWRGGGGGGGGREGHTRFGVVVMPYNNRQWPTVVY